MVSFTDLRPETAFALARAVLRADDSDPDTIAAALDVLDASTDPNDQATVAMLRGEAVQPVRADMGEWHDAPALELPSAEPSRGEWALMIAGVVAVLCIAVALERAWTL